MRKVICTLISTAMCFMFCSGIAAAQTDAQAVDLRNIKEWSMTSNAYGGKLILSDSPETVPEDGILYEDTVKGDLRLFFHHVNGTEIPKKIVALLTNPSDKAIKVTIKRKGFAGPDMDYLRAGKAVQQQYYQPQETTEINILPHTTVHLLPEMDKLKVRKDMLMHGMVDFYSDNPVTVTTMMMPLGTAAEKYILVSQPLAADEWRLRGTFKGYERVLTPQKIYNPDKDGVVAVTLADHEVDRYVEGIDATDGSKTLNYGNYGITYRLSLISEGKSTTNYWLNPQGGEYAGVLLLKYAQKTDMINTPRDKICFAQGTVNNLQNIATLTDKQVVWMEFSPPGASNLPVKIIMSPKPIYHMYEK